MDLLERNAAHPERHPWEVARADFIVALAQGHGLNCRPVRWLDVGSGDGWLASDLARHLDGSSSMLCLDTNYTDEDLVDLTDATTKRVQFSRDRPTGRFDVISLFDVIEHVDDDAAFLQEIITGHLQPAGTVIVTVPADQWLFSAHDVELRHFRRYSPGAAHRLLVASDLEVVSEGGLFASLLPIRAVQVGLERIARRRDSSRKGIGLSRMRHGKILRGLMRRVLSLDGGLSLRLADRGGAFAWPVVLGRLQVEKSVSDGTIVVIVPCYNEATRLDMDRFAELAQVGGISLLFVNDGSTDSTAAMLKSLAQCSPSIGVLTLGANSGKAEAVRTGLRHALARPATSMVAYYDADLAAPPSELHRVVAALKESSDVDVAIGSRVALLGRQIERSWWRHYQGRIFATAASIVLGSQVYDTQCGLKAMRATPALRAAVEMPFASRWSFDVELLYRLLHDSNGRSPRIVEIPLMEWRDVAGSRFSRAARARVLADLMVLGWRSRFWRQRSGPQMAKYSST